MDGYLFCLFFSILDHGAFVVEFNFHCAEENATEADFLRGFLGKVVKAASLQRYIFRHSLILNVKNDQVSVFLASTVTNVCLFDEVNNIEKCIKNANFRLITSVFIRREGNERGREGEKMGEMA